MGPTPRGDPAGVGHHEGQRMTARQAAVAGDTIRTDDGDGVVREWDADTLVYVGVVSE